MKAHCCVCGMEGICSKEGTVREFSIMKDSKMASASIIIISFYFQLTLVR